MSFRTEVLATPLQYKTRLQFMYEILFDVPPPNNNLDAALDHVNNLVNVTVSNAYKVNTEITMLVGRQIIQKIKQAKLTF